MSSAPPATISGSSPPWRGPSQPDLADRVFVAISANDYGVFDGLVEGMLPALAEGGAARLEGRLVEALSTRPDNADERDWRAGMLRRALQAIADGRADVDAWVALIPPQDRASPRIGAEIGRRLLAAGGAKEALTALEAAKPKRRVARVDDRDDPSMSSTVAVMAIGKRSTSKPSMPTGRAGWRSGSLGRLRAAPLGHTAPRLPEKAAGFRGCRSRGAGAATCARLQELRHGTALPSRMAGSCRRGPARPGPGHAEIDGNLYYLLDPAARQIEGKHPLAATLLRRAMIEDTLDGTKSTRYKHAARHLLECRSLAAAIADYAPFETHEAFVSRLRAKHGRKSGFWSLNAGLHEAR